MMLKILMTMPALAVLYFIEKWIECNLPQDKGGTNDYLWGYIYNDVQRLLRPQEPEWFTQQDKKKEEEFKSGVSSGQKKKQDKKKEEEFKSGVSSGQKKKWAEQLGFSSFEYLNPTEQHLLADIVGTMRSNKLDAVKMVKDATGLRLLDAKLFVEALMEL